MKKLLLAAVVSLSAATAFAGDSAERQIYGDPHFEQNRTKAVKMLEQRGYQVHDVDADDHWGSLCWKWKPIKTAANTTSCCLTPT